VFSIYQWQDDFMRQHKEVNWSEAVRDVLKVIINRISDVDLTAKIKEASKQITVSKEDTPNDSSFADEIAELNQPTEEPNGTQ